MVTVALTPQPSAQRLGGLTLNFFQLIVCAQTIPVPPPPDPFHKNSALCNPQLQCKLLPEPRLCIGIYSLYSAQFYESLFSLFLKHILHV